MTFNLEFALKQGESETIEFKERINSPESLVRDISAFSNTKGGTILVGVREPLFVGAWEPNYVVGVSENKLNSCFNTALRKIIGPVKTEIGFMNIDGKKIGIIHIQMSSGIVGSSDGIFRREGKIITPLNAENIIRCVHNGANIEDSLLTISETISQQSKKISIMSGDLADLKSWKIKLLWLSIGALVGAMGKKYIPLFDSIVAATLGYTLVHYYFSRHTRHTGN